MTTLRPTAVVGLTDPIAIACQESSTCALEPSGVVRCWGRGDLGQLGDGLGRPSSAPVAVAGIDDARAIYAGHSNACAVRADASLWCWGTDQRGELGNGPRTGDAVLPELVLLDVAFVSIGAHHMCARKLDRSIVCWGTNTQGQLTDAAGAIADTPFVLAIP